MILQYLPIIDDIDIVFSGANLLLKIRLSALGGGCGRLIVLKTFLTVVSKITPIKEPSGGMMIKSPVLSWDSFPVAHHLNVYSGHFLSFSTT